MTAIIHIVLGASDPEMSAIALLGAVARLRVTQATREGRLVRPGELADSPRPLEGDIWVECAPAGGREALDTAGVARADHHAPGDPGYGRPPAEFMAASSLGQVIAALARQDDLPASWTSVPHYIDGDVGQVGIADDGSWWVVAAGPPGWWSWDLDGPDYSRVQIPQEMVLAAAADHCLGAAYRGECPGVDPLALMRWRAESRAVFQRRAVADVIRDVEETTAALRRAPRVWLPDCPPPVAGVCPRQGYNISGHPDCDGCPVLQAAPPPLHDMRRVDTTWPELPEAASRLGVGYIAGPIPERDGRRKLVVSGTPEQVRAFMRDARRGEVAGEAVDDDSVYGDPARGFAGAYIADSRDGDGQ